MSLHEGHATIGRVAMNKKVLMSLTVFASVLGNVWGADSVSLDAYAGHSFFSVPQVNVSVSGA